MCALLKFVLLKSGLLKKGKINFKCSFLSLPLNNGIYGKQSLPGNQFKILRNVHLLRAGTYETERVMVGDC